MDFWDRISVSARAVPVNATAYQLPAEVEAEESPDGWMLRWRPGGRSKQVGAGTEQILTDFIDLQHASPDEIAAYASEWGTLEICRHGKPKTHQPHRMWSDLDEWGGSPCGAKGGFPTGWRREPVSRWVHYAAQADAIHQLSRNLKNNRQVSVDDLTPLQDLFPPYAFDRSGIGLDQVEVEGRKQSEPPLLTHADHERTLTIALDSWLGMGDVGFHVNWRNGNSELRFGGTGLFGALALQLTLVSTGTGALITCSDCAMPYIPHRMPRSGERNYCGDCRDAGVPARNRQRARRNKQQSEQDQTRT